ncbi:unnamed protein product [Owenia fusiformis]|uniref:Uncharacterized protein n=1 Tax=Owenia fusiformis TaxID=6347 RepID=A0A8S4NKV2_OWEFU|nr:unnamed protein product [Owenia fusiformis]
MRPDIYLLFIFLRLPAYILCSKDYAGYKVIRVNLTSELQRKAIVNIEDKYQLDRWASIGDPISVIDLCIGSDNLHDVQEALEQWKIHSSILINDVQREIDKEKSKTRQRRDLHKRDDETIVGKYATYRETLHWMLELSKRYPNITQVGDIGTTEEGRQVTLIKIGKPQPFFKPIVWIDGAIHAREWISPATVTYIIDKLLKGYNSDFAITDFIDYIDWYILPIANPDGYVYSHEQDRLWRKNRATINGSDCRGVDLNRNWGSHWGELDIASSGEPCNLNYRGPYADSELEVKAIQRVIQNIQESLKVYITLHSYTQKFLMRWSHSKTTAPDHSESERIAYIATDAIEAVHGTSYSVGIAPDVLYAYSGGSPDWMKEKGGATYSFGIELRDSGRHGFLLPADQIIPTGEEIWAGIEQIGEEVLIKYALNTDVLCDGVKNLASLPLDCPTNTTRLSLVGCRLSKLNDGDLGKHYQTLETLNISGNNISVLHNATFAGLKHLHVLNIGDNFYSATELDKHMFSSLPNIRHIEVTSWGDAMKRGTGRIVAKNWMNTFSGLEKSTIETIIFKHISKNPVVVEKSYFKYLKNSPVKNLIFNDMEMVDIDIDCLEYLPHLEVVDLSTNTLEMTFSYFKMIIYLYKLTNLTDVIIKDNVMRHGSVVDEILTKEQAMTFYQFPKSIQLIDFSGSIMTLGSYSFSYGFRVRSDNQLTKVDMSGMKLVHNIGGEVLGFVKLREIHFQNNGCEISPSAFSCRNGAFESIQILDLSYNYLNLSNVENGTQILENCTKLQYLDVSHNRMNSIPPSAFKDTFGLRTLNLSGNNLNDIIMDIKNLVVLETFNISHNKFQMVPKCIRDDLTFLKQHHNISVKLDVTDNPLICSCHSFDFIEWMQVNSKDIHQWDTLRCTYYNDSVIQMRTINVPMLRITCVQRLIFAGTIPSGFLIIVIIITIVCYRRRYKLQYIFLQLRAACRHHGKENADFDFDAFISYSSLDTSWGKKTLYVNLVAKFHYKICIDDINFKPGTEIVAAISRAIAKSNKVILVITQNFLRSKWCTYELNLVTGELASKGRDCILLILKEPLTSLPEELITDTLRSLLDTRIYLEWSDDADRRDVFWRKLRDLLGEPLPRGEHNEQDESPLFPQTIEDENLAQHFLAHGQQPSINDDETPLLKTEDN